MGGPCGIVEKSEFWVDVLALPRCYSRGESLRNVTEAIELYLEVLRDDGRDAPLDSVEVSG